MALPTKYGVVQPYNVQDVYQLTRQGDWPMEYDSTRKFFWAGGSLNIQTGQTVEAANISKSYDLCGPGCLRLKSGLYYQFGASADWALSDHDFTLAAWIRINSFLGTYNSVLSHIVFYAGRGWALQVLSNKIQFYYTTNGSTDATVSVATTINTGTNYHIAVTRSGNLMYFFANGTLLNAGGTAFNATIYNPTTALLGIGVFATDELQNIDGWVGGIELTNGRARWTADFTPPTVPY